MHFFLQLVSFNETLLKKILEDIFAMQKNKNKNKLDEDTTLVVGKKLLNKDISQIFRSSHQRWSVKNVLENFTKFTGKHLCFATSLKNSNTGVFL